MNQFLYFFLKYPFRYKINFLQLYWNTLLGNIFKINIPTEFIKINHNLHEFKNQKEFDFKIKETEIVLYNSINNKHIKSFAKDYSSDLFVYDQIFFEKEYESIVAICSQIGLEPQTIIDAGCNVGYTSTFLNCYYPNAYFIAIEPSQSNRTQIVKNFEGGSLKNYKLYPNGLWSASTTLYLQNDFRDGLNRSLYLSEKSSTEIIKTVSLWEIVQENNLQTIDFLKMDIEGAEADIFNNDPFLQNWLAITKIIAIEIHDEFNCREKIEHTLVNANFELKYSGELTIGIKR